MTDALRKREKRMRSGKIKQCTWGSQFGIENAYGEPWGPRTFDTKDSAQRYLDDKRKAWGSNGLEKHRVVPVRVTVRIVNSKNEAKP